MLEFSRCVILIEVRIALIYRAADHSAACLSAVVTEIAFGKAFHVFACGYIHTVECFECIGAVRILFDAARYAVAAYGNLPVGIVIASGRYATVYIGHDGIAVFVSIRFRRYVLERRGDLIRLDCKERYVGYSYFVG